MTELHILFISIAAFCAGAMNSIAGGGTFFSFPVLLAIGLPPVVSNATNSVALWPASLSSAWAYRKELKRYRKYLISMGIASLIGGISGCLLLLYTKDALFYRLIPWLLLFATLLFAFSGKISSIMRNVKPSAHHSGNVGALAMQVGVAAYGGFFGAGMGILILASLAMAGHEDVHEINAIKNFLSAIVYSVTVVTFVIAGAVSWPHTLVMIVAATIGGYTGAHFSRKIPPLWLRGFIIAVGFFLSAFYFFKT